MNDYLGETNLVEYIVLPMLALNKYSFGRSNFIKATLSRDLKVLTIKLNLPYSGNIEEMNYYITDYSVDKFTFIDFRIPDSKLEDVKLFTEGKLSAISPLSKTSIKSLSTLNWRKKINGKMYSSILLRCLYPTMDFVKSLEKIHGCELEGEELVEINKENIYD